MIDAILAQRLLQQQFYNVDKNGSPSRYTLIAVCIEHEAR
jgi:hypothetical protein